MGYLILAICLIWAPSALAIKTSKPLLWLRAQDSFSRLTISPKGHYIAYTDNKDLGLYLLEVSSQRVFRVTHFQVGAGFFWSPHGHRLIYREQEKRPDGNVESRLQAYDARLKQNVLLESYPFRTGFPTYDPRDMRFHLIKPTGITTKKLDFPGVRLGKWQIYQRTENGKWLATQNAILWVTQGGLTLREMKDDGSGIDSYSISPDGSVMAWATKSGRIYISDKGANPKFYAYGKDPSWHPSKALLLFAGGRVVGNKSVSYDLRIGDLKGVSRFLTNTQFSSERWPRFATDGRTIYFTKAKTTDIFQMEFSE